MVPSPPATTSRPSGGRALDARLSACWRPLPVVCSSKRTMTPSRRSDLTARRARRADPEWRLTTMATRRRSARPESARLPGAACSAMAPPKAAPPRAAIIANHVPRSEFARFRPHRAVQMAVPEAIGSRCAGQIRAAAHAKATPGGACRRPALVPRRGMTLPTQAKTMVSAEVERFFRMRRLAATMVAIASTTNKACSKNARPKVSKCRTEDVSRSFPPPIVRHQRPRSKHPSRDCTEAATRGHHADRGMSRARPLTHLGESRI